MTWSSHHLWSQSTGMAKVGGVHLHSMNIVTLSNLDNYHS